MGSGVRISPGAPYLKGFPQQPQRKLFLVLPVCYPCLVFLAFRWRALAAAFDALVAIALRCSAVKRWLRTLEPLRPMREK
jgi:hypothetical protein